MSKEIKRIRSEQFWEEFEVEVRTGVIVADEGHLCCKIFELDNNKSVATGYLDKDDKFIRYSMNDIEEGL